MAISFLSVLFGAVCLVAMPLAGAQTSSPAAPATAPAQRSDMAHASAFAGYRPFRDEAVGSWVKANSEVARVGGWRTYAKEASTGPQKDGKQ